MSNKVSHPQPSGRLSFVKRKAFAQHNIYYSLVWRKKAPVQKMNESYILWNLFFYAVNDVKNVARLVRNIICACQTKCFFTPVTPSSTYAGHV